MAVVVIPALLRGLTGGRDRVAAGGRNVRELIDDLDRRYPGLSAQLLSDGELKPSIAVAIDGEVGTGGILDPVGENSEVHFLPAIGGGALPVQARRPRFFRTDG